MSHKAIYRQPLLGISMKKSHLHTNANIFIFGLTCATKVVLQQALQLVASKLPVKVAPCDKALRYNNVYNGAVVGPMPAVSGFGFGFWLVAFAAVVMLRLWLI